jgi:hypothetical protein
MLTLIKPHISKGKNREWISEYQCICGTVIKRADTLVNNGRVKSCGCLTIKARAKNAGKLFKTHGLSKTKEYKIWGSMVARCEIHSASSYSYYGGRGIKVCDRWRNSFEAFLVDMGKCPVGYSIERIDNDGNYGPTNCKWATKSEQMKNRRPFKRRNQ